MKCGDTTLSVCQSTNDYGPASKPIACRDLGGFGLSNIVFSFQISLQFLASILTKKYFGSQQSLFAGPAREIIVCVKRYFILKTIFGWWSVGRFYISELLKPKLTNFSWCGKNEFEEKHSNTVHRICPLDLLVTRFPLTSAQYLYTCTCLWSLPWIYLLKMRSKHQIFTTARMWVVAFCV